MKQKVVKLLIQCGAELNSLNSDGKTPLWLALDELLKGHVYHSSDLNSRKEVVDFLLSQPGVKLEFAFDDFIPRLLVILSKRGKWIYSFGQLQFWFSATCL